MSTDGLLVYEAAFERVKGFRTFKKVARTPMKQVQPENLPYLGVYLMREAMGAEGDVAVAQPRFIHQLHLGFSGAIADTDEYEAQAAVDQAMSQIADALLTDPTFIKYVDGFVSIDRKLVYSQVGETALAEIQMELVCQFRTEWEPKVPDELKVIHVTVDTKPDDDESDTIQAEYDLPQ